MVLSLPKNVELVENRFVQMDWPAGYFVTQGTNFFHGGAVNYKNDEGKLTGVAFAREESAFIGFSDNGELMTAEELMNIIIEIAREQSDLVAEQQLPEDTLNDVDELMPIYLHGSEAPTFNREEWRNELSDEDIADIEARIEDLSTFEELEEVTDMVGEEFEDSQLRPPKF